MWPPVVGPSPDVLRSRGALEECVPAQDLPLGPEWPSWHSDGPPGDTSDVRNPVLCGRRAASTASELSSFPFPMGLRDMMGIQKANECY